jgi:hypothetical protein
MRARLRMQPSEIEARRSFHRERALLVLPKVVGSNLRCIDHRSRAMPKRTLIALPDKIAGRSAA